MELAELVLEYIQVLIYPLIILLVLAFFRTELKLLLKGKLTAKYKDLTITIEKQAKELKAAEDRAKLVAEKIDIVQQSEQKQPKTADDKSERKIKDLLDQSMELLNLTTNEYSIIDYLVQKDNVGVHDVELVETFIGPTKDMHSGQFYGARSAIQSTLSNLKSKGILIEEKNKFFISHKIFLEYFKNR